MAVLDDPELNAALGLATPVSTEVPRGRGKLDDSALDAALGIAGARPQLPIRAPETTGQKLTRWYDVATRLSDYLMNQAPRIAAKVPGGVPETTPMSLQYLIPDTAQRAQAEKGGREALKIAGLERGVAPGVAQEAIEQTAQVLRPESVVTLPLLAAAGPFARWAARTGPVIAGARRVVPEVASAISAAGKPSISTEVAERAKRLAEIARRARAGQAAEEQIGERAKVAEEMKAPPTPKVEVEVTPPSQPSPLKGEGGVPTSPSAPLAPLTDLYGERAVPEEMARPVEPRAPLPAAGEWSPSAEATASAGPAQPIQLTWATQLGRQMGWEPAETHAQFETTYRKPIAQGTEGELTDFEKKMSLRVKQWQSEKAKQDIANRVAEADRKAAAMPPDQAKVAADLLGQPPETASRRIARLREAHRQVGGATIEDIIQQQEEGRVGPARARREVIEEMGPAGRKKKGVSYEEQAEIAHERHAIETGMDEWQKTHDEIFQKMGAAEAAAFRRQTPMYAAHDVDRIFKKGSAAEDQRIEAWRDRIQAETGKPAAPSDEAASRTLDSYAAMEPVDQQVAQDPRPAATAAEETAQAVSIPVRTVFQEAAQAMRAGGITPAELHAFTMENSPILDGSILVPDAMAHRAAYARALFEDDPKRVLSEELAGLRRSWEEMRPPSPPTPPPPLKGGGATPRPGARPEEKFPGYQGRDFIVPIAESPEFASKFSNSFVMETRKALAGQKKDFDTFTGRFREVVEKWGSETAEERRRIIDAREAGNPEGLTEKERAYFDAEKMYDLYAERLQKIGKEYPTLRFKGKYHPHSGDPADQMAYVKPAWDGAADQMIPEGVTPDLPDEVRSPNLLRRELDESDAHYRIPLFDQFARYAWRMERTIHFEPVAYKWAKAINQLQDGWPGMSEKSMLRRYWWSMLGRPMEDDLLVRRKLAKVAELTAKIPVLGDMMGALARAKRPLGAPTEWLNKAEQIHALWWNIKTAFKHLPQLASVASREGVVNTGLGLLGRPKGVETTAAADLLAAYEHGQSFSLPEKAVEGLSKLSTLHLSKVLFPFTRRLAVNASYWKSLRDGISFLRETPWEEEGLYRPARMGVRMESQADRNAEAAMMRAIPDVSKAGIDPRMRLSLVRTFMLFRKQPLKTMEALIHDTLRATETGQAYRDLQAAQKRGDAEAARAAYVKLRDDIMVPLRTLALFGGFGVGSYEAAKHGWATVHAVTNYLNPVQWLAEGQANQGQGTRVPILGLQAQMPAPALENGYKLTSDLHMWLMSQKHALKDHPFWNDVLAVAGQGPLGTGALAWHQAWHLPKDDPRAQAALKLIYDTGGSAYQTYTKLRYMLKTGRMPPAEEAFDYKLLRERGAMEALTPKEREELVPGGVSRGQALLRMLGASGEKLRQQELAAKAEAGARAAIEEKKRKRALESTSQLMRP